MEDITKHTIKIVKSVSNPTTSLKKKIAEVAFEILIITFAVTLAQFLERQRENDVKKHEANEFLVGLRVDIVNDIEQAKRNKIFYTEAQKKYKYLSDITNSKKFNADSLNQAVAFVSNNTTFRPNISRFEGFKSAGKLEEIGDKKLLQDILTFYEQTTPSLQLSEGGWVNMQRQLNSVLILSQVSYKNGTNNNYQVMNMPQAHNLAARLIPWAQLYERYDNIINLGQTIVQQIDRDAKD